MVTKTPKLHTMNAFDSKRFELLQVSLRADIEQHKKMIEHVKKEVAETMRSNPSVNQIHPTTFLNMTLWKRYAQTLSYLHNRGPKAKYEKCLRKYREVAADITVAEMEDDGAEVRNFTVDDNDQIVPAYEPHKVTRGENEYLELCNHLKKDFENMEELGNAMTRYNAWKS
tara:strand:+ start:51 stop:560 length:510 start_codon:yes stop_codon:yes gene_type:complete